MGAQVASSLRETQLAGIAAASVMCCFNGQVSETTQEFKHVQDLASKDIPLSPL